MINQAAPTSSINAPSSASSQDQLEIASFHKHDWQTMLTHALRGRLGYHSYGSDHFDPVDAARLIMTQQEQSKIISADLQRACYLTVSALLGHGGSFAMAGKKAKVNSSLAVTLLKDLVRRGWTSHACRSDCLSSYEEGFRDLAIQSLKAAHREVFNAKPDHAPTAEQVSALRLDLEGLKPIFSTEIFAAITHVLEHQASRS